MKKVLMLVLVLVLLPFSWAMARDIEIEFTYDDQGYQQLVALSFDVFIDGVLLCNAVSVEVPEGSPQLHECPIDMVVVGSHDFTMQGLLADESRSPVSAPYSYVVTPAPKAPQIIRIKARGNS